MANALRHFTFGIGCPEGMLELDICETHHLLVMSLVWLGIFRFVPFFHGCSMTSSAGKLRHFLTLLFWTKSCSIRQICGVSQQGTDTMVVCLRFGQVLRVHVHVRLKSGFTFGDQELRVSLLLGQWNWW